MEGKFGFLPFLAGTFWCTLEGFQQFAYERGVFCRPFLNYMYSMVPYVISDEELIQIFDVMKDWFH